MGNAIHFVADRLSAIFFGGSDPRSCTRVYVSYNHIILPANHDKIVLCYLFYSLTPTCLLLQVEL